MSTPAPTPAVAAANPRRRFLLRLVFVIVVLGLLTWAAWYWFDGRWYASTDDAYARANVVEVTPLVPGTVTAIYANDNDYVRAGQTLVQFDAADARVALQRAKANLALTVRRVRALYAGAGAAQALLATRQIELRRAEQDYARVLMLKGTGAISAQDLQHAGDALAAARAALGHVAGHRCQQPGAHLVQIGLAQHGGGGQHVGLLGQHGFGDRRAAAVQLLARGAKGGARRGQRIAGMLQILCRDGAGTLQLEHARVILFGAA